MEGFRIITDRELKTQSLINVSKDGNKVISTVEDPVSSTELELFEELKKQDNSNLPLVGYDNTVVFLPNEHQRFPYVSMAHFFLAKTLSQDESVINTRSLADLGSGAGFLGNYAAKNFEGLQEGRVIFGDLFSESINAALHAYMVNNHKSLEELNLSEANKGIRIKAKGNQTVEFRIGDVTNTMHGENIETAVASPVYIPGVCEVFPQAFAVFGMVSKNMGADFYVGHSSLADRVVEEAATQTGAKLTDVNSRRSQLDLSTSDSRLRDPVETLETLKSLGLTIEGSSGNPRYMHNLKVSKMSYK